MSDEKKPIETLLHAYCEAKFGHDWTENLSEEIFGPVREAFFAAAGVSMIIGREYDEIYRAAARELFEHSVITERLRAAL